MRATELTSCFRHQEVNTRPNKRPLFLRFRHKLTSDNVLGGDIKKSCNFRAECRPERIHLNGNLKIFPMLKGSTVLSTGIKTL